MSGENIGIMGGTFNPIHNGHLLMAQEALEQYALDGVVFIPTGLQWMKKDNPDLLDREHRFQMTALATYDNPAFSVSRMEIDREGNTYTYETLEELHEKLAGCNFFYIVGADSLASMVKWKRAERIFELATILCAVRDQTSKEELSGIMNALSEKFSADIRFLDMPRMDISSTQLRNLVREGRSIRYMVPDKVRTYIQEHRLWMT